MVRLFDELKIKIYVNTVDSCVKTAVTALENDLVGVFGKPVSCGSYCEADIVILSAEEAKDYLEVSEIA
ncbi:MAG: hypothetical protein ACK5LL_03560 [Suipraeoptans sp.]